nr:flavin reductase [Consotaella salsifontis]
MARFAASVNIVTTDGPAGPRGVTATSVCSVSDDPPIILVCLNAQGPLNERFVENEVFALNVLGAEQEPVARAFAGEGRLSTEERFATARWTRLGSGAPILEGALASFDCRLRERTKVATHNVLFGEVIGVRTGGDDASLLYLGRRYRSLGS